jgi:hypothetical protein
MKRLIRFSFLIALLTVADSTAAVSQSLSATIQPSITAEEILERNISALGGRENIQKGSSYFMKATLEMPRRGVRGTLEVWGKAPDKLLTVTVIDRVGEIKQGYDGKAAWSRDPYQGLRDLEGEDLEKIRYQSIFNPELKWRELFEKVQLTGVERVGDREAYVVRLIGKEGFTITKYFDTATFLLIRSDVVDVGPNGKIPIETRYSDYREIDGVKTAFQWTQKTPIGEAVIKIVEANSNIRIEDSFFKKPQ